MRLQNLGYLLSTYRPGQGIDDDVLVLEWDESTWRRGGDGQILAPDSLIDQVNSDWVSFSDVVRIESDTFHTWVPQSVGFRYFANARMNTTAVLPATGDELIISLADIGHDNGDTTVLFDRIEFLPDCTDPVTRTLWSVQGIYLD